MIKIRRAIILVAATLPLMIAFQNCGQNLEVSQHPESSTFKRAEECMAGKSTAGACLFQKSPVSQAGKAVAADYIGGYQSSPVNIDELSGTYLENNHFQIVTARTSRLPKTSGFRHYFNPSNSNLEQVSSYYFTNELRNWLIARGGSAHQNQGFKVVADSSFSGFIPSKKEVHLERNGVNLPAALDGSIVQHVYGQAYIWAATSGQSHADMSATAKSCNDARGFNSPAGCCKDANGCTAAIISGAADFMVAAYFGASGTRIGEGWKNDISGLRTCGLSRDPAAQSKLTRSQAHQACSSRGSSGNITTMGLLYASIWWEARLKASDTLDFDKLFVRHLTEIRSDDTIATLKTKILSLDSSAFASRHSSNLNAEFTRRGF